MGGDVAWGSEFLRGDNRRLTQDFIYIYQLISIVVQLK